MHIFFFKPYGLKTSYTKGVRFYKKKKKRCCRNEKVNLLFVTYGYFWYFKKLLGIPAKILGVPSSSAIFLGQLLLAILQLLLK